MVVNKELTPEVDCGRSGSCHLLIDSFALPGAKDAPVVVVIPGGPMAPGNRGDLWSLARWLAWHGAVAFTSDYRASPKWGGGYPETFADVACAISYARTNARRLGGDPSSVTLLAHSFGGFPLAVLSLSSRDYAGAAPCNAPSSGGRPDAAIGIAGVYTFDRLGEDFLTEFFGGDRSSGAGARWELADPDRLALRPDARRIPILLLVGTLDVSTPLQTAQSFVGALGGDANARVVEIDGADHVSILESPRMVELVGDELDR